MMNYRLFFTISLFRFLSTYHLPLSNGLIRKKYGVALLTFEPLR